MVDYGNFVIELRNHSFPQKKIPTREAQVRLVLKLPKDLRMDFWTEYCEKQRDTEMTTKSIASSIKKFSEERNLSAPPAKKWAQKSRENFLRFKAALLEEAVGQDPQIGQLIFELGKRLEEMINENRNSRSSALVATR